MTVSSEMSIFERHASSLAVLSVTETALTTIIGRGCTRIHTLVADWNHRSQRLNEFFHLERQGSQLALRRVLGKRFETAGE